MAKENSVVTRCLQRWRGDLLETFEGMVRDPFVQGRGRRWDRDFSGEVGPYDIHYAVFLVVVSLIPAAVAAYVSPEVRWKMMARLFGSPLQAVISGFLTSCLIFLGSHVNRVPRPFSVAFKLMLRIMSVHPLLGFFAVVPWGSALGLLVYGFFVVRGVRKTYVMPLQNALLFFGVIYFVFALLQFQALLSPPSPERLKYFSNASPVSSEVFSA